MELTSFSTIPPSKKQHILERKYAPKHISGYDLDKVNECDLIQVVLFWEADSVEYVDRRFRMKAYPTCYIYKEGAYDVYKGHFFNVCDALKKYYRLDFKQAYAVLDLFMRSESDQMSIATYLDQHYADMEKELPAAQNYMKVILSKNLYEQPDNNSYTRSFAYLHTKRGIDCDLILKFRDEGYMMMDSNHNLCFLRREGDTADGKLVGLTQWGTCSNQKYIRHYGLYRNVGFFYAEKETTLYEDLYVFENVIEMMSFLSLVHMNVFTLQSKNNCFLTLNGRNVLCMSRFLRSHPEIKKVFSCVRNSNNNNLPNKIERYSYRKTENMSWVLRDYNLTHYSDLQTWNDLLCMLQGLPLFRTSDEIEYQRNLEQYQEEHQEAIWNTPEERASSFFRERKGEKAFFKEKESPNNFEKEMGMVRKRLEEFRRKTKE